MYSIFSPQTTQNTCGWEIHMFVQRLRLRAHLHLAPLQIVSDTPTTKATSRRFAFPSSGPRRFSTTHQMLLFTFDVQSLYPSIPTPEGLHALRKMIQGHFPLEELNLIMSLASLTLPTPLIDVQWRILATNARNNNG